MQLNLKLETGNETTKKRVAEATAKKKKAQYEPSWSEVWLTGYDTHTGRRKDGILQSKLTDNDKRKLLEVKKVVETGELGSGVESLKKFTKAHAMRLYKELQELRREQIIADMIKNKPANYLLVTNELELARIVQLLEQEELVALDTETTGVDVHGESVTVGISMSLDKADIHFYVPYRHTTGEQQLEPERVFKALRPALENPDIKKVLHNAKFDFHILRKDGINVRGLHMDTMVAMHVLSENEISYALKNLATKYGKSFGFEDKSSTYEELFGKGGFEGTPLDIGHIYACKDTHLTLQLYKWIDSHLEKRPELWEVYYKIEQETTLVCIEMEKNGFAIDFEYAKKYQQELTAQVANLEEQLKQELGDININSNQQLAEVLYGKLGLEDISKERKVDADTLNTLSEDCEALKVLLEYRELKKLLSTYIEPLPQKVGADGRLHGEFKQSGTATGRFSSSNPK